MSRTAVFQQDILWGAPEDNLARLDEALQSAPESDVYVFPEMFSTGFATLEDSVVEHEPCMTLEWMKKKAAEKNAAIAGSVALEIGGRLHNRFFFVKPDGSTAVYDKRHLFLYGGEGEKFDAGDSRTVVEWRGVRYLLAVCYDVRFPVWLRNLGDYDAMILVANWPEARRFAWDTLVRARAIENQCYVLAANRTGDDPACHYEGGSVILGPYGETLAATADSHEEWIAADIDIQHLREYEVKFPVRGDADKFRLI